MQQELEEALRHLKTSPLVDPGEIAALHVKAQELRETAPKDALNIFRTLAMVADKTRFATNDEKLHFFSIASDLGWKLGEPKWHFDRRAAELLRDLGNLSLAGDQYERAAQSFIREGLDNKISTVHNWQFQYQMLREARMCYEASGFSEDASRCFVEGMKLRRDNARTLLGKAKGWACYVFWSWGESPLKVAIWAAVWIVLFSWGYCATGMTASGESRYDFAEALYFSVVTFTTLGYGDLTPATRAGKLLAATEALSGIFFTGLFLVTFVKRFSR
jgi:hypothetical protein